jgi:hypothetical protein
MSMNLKVNHKHSHSPSSHCSELEDSGFSQQAFSKFRWQLNHTAISINALYMRS